MTIASIVLIVFGLVVVAPDAALLQALVVRLVHRADDGGIAVLVLAERSLHDDGRLLRAVQLLPLVVRVPVFVELLLLLQQLHEEVVRGLALVLASLHPGPEAGASKDAGDDLCDVQPD